MQQVIARNEAEYCGRVPLHQTNLIQPHGYLLVVHAPDLRIVQASENAETVFQQPVAAVVEKKLTDYLPAAQVEELLKRFTNTEARLPFVFSFASGDYQGTVKRQDAFYIIELSKEPQQARSNDSFMHGYQQLKYAMAAIEKTKSITEAAEVVVQEIKRISGFEKVMLYRFDEAWNGDVIAEVAEEGMDRYLGLKFPASDIPRQAREIYRTTAWRLIPDIQYKPVRLYPTINPVTNAFTNLSDSNLRSVAAVHLEYLQNMKVQASMSIRVLHNDKLWGLIACHHRTAQFLSFETCSLLELLSYVISAKISSLIGSETYQFHAQMQDIQTKIVQEVYASGNMAKGLSNSKEELAQLLNAGGLAIVLNGAITTWGKVPADSDIEDLVLWLQTIETEGVKQWSNLAAVYDPAQGFAAEASGVLALPVQPEKGSFVLAFRPEEVEEVSWSGNPGEAVKLESDGVKYHPRASFDIWKQTVRQTAVPWTKDEKEVAEDFRNFMVDYTLRKA